MKTIELLDSEKDFLTEEAYNSLRTNIMFCGENVKTIALTSCFPNEGKSTVSRKLAINLAKIEKKVLYIDADMRKSVLMGKVNVEGETLGLAHVLTGQAEIKDAVYQVKDNDNLNVIFTGSFPPNPSELLSSSKFKTIIADLRKDYDYIIIDTPPVGAVIDAAIIASVCDGAIVVIKANSTSYKAVRNAKIQLEKSNCRILGAVLNGAEVNKKAYYNKYYRD